MLIAALVAATPAAAQDGHSVFFARSSVGFGYGHYVYPDGLSTQAGRNGGGPAVSLIGELGVRFGGGFILAGAFSFEPIVWMNSTSPRGTQYPGELGPMGFAGVTLGAAFERVAITAMIGFGGGGNSHSGGYGLFVAPNLAFSIVRFGRGHLQLFLRPVYGFLGSSPGISMYFAGGGGVALSWQ